MDLEVAIPGIEKIADRIWEAKLSPSDVRKLSPGSGSAGAVSVVVLLSKPKVDGESLRFALEDAHVANVGSTERAILIDGVAPLGTMERLSLQLSQNSAKLKPGDRVFLDTLKVLPEEVQKAGFDLLLGVRAHFPGELKRVSETRFQETPDNFWFATVQPRVESILITVRGMPDRFSPSSLDIKEDRRPYSRFKVRSKAEVSEALRIIKGAVQKGR